MTVLFTDVVGSTKLAAELEDRRWRTLLTHHHRLVRRELRRFRGREIDTAGDGFLATFDEPTDGIRCAWAVTEAVRELGLEVRAGLHTGEVEMEDGAVSGIAVHTAARIVGFAGPGEVMVSGTLRELAAGSGARFEDRGRRRLRGFPGTWQIFAVSNLDGVPRQPAPPPELAAARRARVGEPAPRRSRTALMLMAVIAVLAVVAWVLVTPTDEEPPSRPRASLVRMDPETGEVTSTAPLDVPIWRGLAAGEGGVWVLQQLPGRHVVAHLEPSNGNIVNTVDLREAAVPRDIIVGERAVWVLSSGPGLVEALISHVNPATDRVIRQTSVGALQTDDPAGLAIGQGAAWVDLKNGVLARLDPDSARVVAKRDAITSAGGVAAGEDFVWVIDELSDTVFQVDPTTLDIHSRISMPGSADQIAVGEGYVWILDREAGSVVRLNPRSRALDDPVRVGDEPEDMVAAFGYVWVVDEANGTVSRVHPSTRVVKTINVGGAPTSIAADSDLGAIWVAGPEAPPQVF